MRKVDKIHYDLAKLGVEGLLKKIFSQPRIERPKSGPGQDQLRDFLIESKNDTLV